MRDQASRGEASRDGGWLLLVDPPAPGAWNMALDEALLEAAEAEGLRALRLYAWDPPAISFGRNEPALRRYDRAAIRERRLATVRRPTGGRAVWHHHEVTYSVAAPERAFGTLPATCMEIHSMLAAALRRLGVDARLAPARPESGVGAGACFATAAGGEVLMTGDGKVVGSAQVRRSSAFLQHGSVLLVAEQEVVTDLTLGGSREPLAAGLAECLGPRATWDLVADAVAREAASRWGAPRRPSPLPETTLRRAEALRARYEDPAWTWRR